MAREAKDHELHSPVDLPGKPLVGRHPLNWTALTIVVAALFLLCANAGTLAAWVDEKPPGAIQLQASELAGRWKDRMDAIGITTPRARMHGWWKQAQAARFGDEAQGETL